METRQSYGFNRRVRPWKALCAFLRVARDPEDTESGARFVFALDGNAREHLFQRFLQHPVGLEILADGRCLSSLLKDRARLRRLPKDTLGHAYVAFMDEEGISLESLRSTTDAASVEFREGLDEDRLLVHDRIGAMHDLWHVVTGYSRDLLGELALLAFSYVQLGTPAFRVLTAISTPFTEWRAPGTKALVEGARRRAKEAVWLPAQDWEQLLDKPLELVRQELRLGPPPAYTRYFRP